MSRQGRRETGGGGEPGGKRAAGAAPELPARPATLYAAALVMGLQGLALVALAVVFAAGGAASPAARGPLVGLAGMFAVMAVLLFAVTRGLLGFRRWARPFSVAWNLVLLPFAWSIRPGAIPGDTGATFVVVLAAAVLGLVFIFLPPTVRAYDAALRAAEESRRD